MRKSLAKTTPPVLAGVVKERTPMDAAAQIRNCEYHGATGIDLHLSCLDEQYKNAESIGRIIQSSRVPVLALNYNLSYDKGFYETTEETRTGLLLKAVEAGAAAVDIQGYTFDLESKGKFREEFLNLGYSFIQGKPNEVVVDETIIEKQMAIIQQVHQMGAEVLLSNHLGIPMQAEALVELALFLEKRQPDIIKIVAPAETDEELAEAFRAMLLLKKEVKTPVSYHCSGSKGALTRIVNPLLGGFLCFCNDSYQQNSDMNQPLLETADTIFRNIKKVL